MCFLVMRSDVPNPRYTTSESNKHTFGMMRTIKREFTVNEMCDIVDKMWRQVRNLLKGTLKKYHGPQKGYLATFNDFHGHIFGTSDSLGGPVDVTDAAEGDVSQKIWDTLFPILNGINKHMSSFLKGCFNVEEADLSPFAAAFTHDVTSILDRFVAYLPKKRKRTKLLRNSKMMTTVSMKLTKATQQQ